MRTPGLSSFASPIRRARSRVSVVAPTLTALVFTLVAIPPVLSIPAASAGVASAADPTDPTADPTGPLESTQVEPFTAADAEPRLVEDATTATSVTYAYPDGSFVAEISSVPVNYLDENEEWQEIDNTLVPAEGGSAEGGEYAFENAANEFSVALPTDPGTTPVKVTRDGAWVSVLMRGVDDGELAVADATATIDEVANAGRVELDVVETGLKETIVLDQAPNAAAGVLRYRYDLAASPGLTPRLRGDGVIEFTDSAGERVFEIPAGVMDDSATPVPASSNAVAYDLVPAGDGVGAGEGWTLRVTPDLEWLIDPARVYPVKIDPSVMLPADQTFACVLAESNKTTSFCGNNQQVIYAGRLNTGASRYRSTLFFDTAGIGTDVTITDAEVRLNAIYASNPGTALVTQLQRAGSAWNQNATWNSPGSSASWPGSNPGNPQTGVGDTSNTRTDGGTANPNRVYGGLGPLVKSWVNGSKTNFGLVLTATNETTVNTLGFTSPSASNAEGDRPKMVVTYQLQPDRAQDAGDREFWTYETRQLTDTMSAKVNVGNGNLLLSAQDFTIAGINGWDLSMSRYYNSAYSTTGFNYMGLGWSSPLGNTVQLEKTSTTNRSKVDFFGPSGYRVTFRDNDSDGTYEVREAPGMNADLQYRTGSSFADKEFVLTMFDESKYFFDDRPQEITANGAGGTGKYARLVRSEDANGNALSYTYDTTDQRRVTRVTDTRNRTARMVYTNDLLTSIGIYTAAGGEIQRYRYTYTGIGPANSLAVLAETSLESVQPVLGTFEDSPAASMKSVGAITRYEYETTAPYRLKGSGTPARSPTPALPGRMPARAGPRSSPTPRRPTTTTRGSRRCSAGSPLKPPGAVLRGRGST